MFSYFHANTSFDFVSNIFANISSLKEGRQYMIEQNMIMKVIDLLLAKSNPINKHRKENLFSVLRNCLFEHEKYAKDFQ
jgi:surface polysaccharide O-acyltransferase-like enzyme